MWDLDKHTSSKAVAVVGHAGPPRGCRSGAVKSVMYNLYDGTTMYANQFGVTHVTQCRNLPMRYEEGFERYNIAIAFTYYATA